MATYNPSERLETIAKKVMQEHPNLAHLDVPECRIAYQTSDQEKKNGDKRVFADTERVKDKYKEYMPYDFVITFYWPNCENLTPEKLEHLMYHELRHVGYAGEKFFVIPHEIEDFRDVIDSWGLDWL